MSGEEERKAGDVEEWRPLKASIEQSVITEEEGRQTASLFPCRHEKTHINFQVEGSLAPAASSSLCWAAARSSLLWFIHHKKEGRHLSRGILGNLAWPETWRWRRRRWRAVGNGTLLLFTAHLAPLCTPTPTQFTRTIGGPAALCWSTPLMDVRGAARERSDGAGGGGRGGGSRSESLASLSENLDRQQRGLLGRAFGGRRTGITVLASQPKDFSGQWGAPT